MAMRRKIQVTVLIAALFLVGVPLGFAEERQFVGMLVKVDVESQQVELAGNVLLEISDSSRFFDRAGKQVELNAFVESASQPSTEDRKPLTLTYYKATANKDGKLMIDWISLAGPIEE
jgi:hypothetical protein